MLPISDFLFIYFSMPRGSHTKISDEKLFEIAHWVDSHPDASIRRMCRRFGLRRTTAYRLRGERLSGGIEFHPRARRERPRKDYAVPHARIRHILRADCSLNHRGVSEMLSWKLTFLLALCEGL